MVISILLCSVYYCLPPGAACLILRLLDINWELNKVDLLIYTYLSKSMFLFIKKWYFQFSLMLYCKIDL
jgi:hypothetical protein